MITLLVPTKNRTNYLTRFLNYYKEVGFQGTINIGDSSDGEHLEQNRKLIKSLKGQLNINHYEYPDLDVTLCSAKLVELVTTPYAAWICDDDLLIAPTLERAVEFLESNRDYNGAWGKIIKIKIQAQAVFGPITFCKGLKPPKVEAENGADRFLELAGHFFDVLFAVYRIGTLKKMFGSQKLMIDLNELAHNRFPNFVAVINGKIKDLDALYLVRNRHDQHLGSTRPDGFDLITDSGWNSAFNVFRDALVNELMIQDNIAKEEATEVFKKGFWQLMNLSLRKEWKSRYMKKQPHLLHANTPEKMQELLFGGIIKKQKRLLGDVAHRIYSKLDSNYNPLKENKSLSGLLNPDSPYHNDFMPIYKVVTGSSKMGKVQS